MPRQARIKSAIGIYHIMLRGVNQQQIFEEREDFEKFLQILKDSKAISEFKLFAYCLMGNHIHILLQETKEPIELLMKRIATRFVYWYNIKYRRAGHLFQDRFKSEPIENDLYLLTVIRYIHQNPIKAGICKSVSDYEFSSYKEYFKDSDLIDGDYVFEIIEKEAFKTFNNEKVFDICLDVEDKPKIKVTDEQAKKIIEKVTKCRNVAEFQMLSINNRDKYLKRLRESGLSIRQISRLTGTSYYLTQKI
ncbi:MAG: transposase [Ruminococcaceae bacterium]|nr:transposase [Oscillospiraceae bacterium]